jgi:drug/metabolite transporter (DMT)-like permease
MNALFPLLAAIFQAGSFTLDKVTLSLRRITFLTYTGISFPLSLLIILILFLVIRPPFNTELLFGTYFWLLLFSIFMKLIGNLLFYRALDGDQLSEIEIIHLANAIPIIIVTSYLFADERNLSIIVPALIVSVALIWSHWEHHHFRIRKHTIPLVWFGFIGAPINASISKILLVDWHPISLELVRTGAVAILLAPFFFRAIGKIENKAFRYLILTNILTTAGWLFFYTGYQKLGVVYTLLLYSIQPLLVYMASVYFLKEKPHWKKSVAFAVVLISIIGAQILGGS